MVNYLEAVEPDSDFYDIAPVVIEGRAAFDVPRERLFAMLDEVDIPPLRTEWVTEPPRGNGSRRMLRVAGRHLNTGYFTRFERPREQRFYLGELNVPGVRRLAAVMWFEELGVSRSAIRWRLAIEPRLLAGRTGRPLGVARMIGDPVLSAAMRVVFGYGLRRRGAL